MVEFFQLILAVTLIGVAFTIPPIKRSEVVDPRLLIDDYVRKLLDEADAKHNK